ncbi:MAG: hypothetical protein LV481_14890 [Methylacidiphilales bacterium]|nr:hypothetical protein [Candidatus Methylacidiphilales bacterium]
MISDSHLLGQTPIDLTQSQLTPKSYNPAAILKTANQLIAVGDEITYNCLLAYCKKSSQSVSSSMVCDDYVTWLCLLLYDPNPNTTLETPFLGFPDFPFGFYGQGHQDSVTWPKFPLAFCKGVPFLLVEYYQCLGPTNPGSYYAKLYHKNGIFRTQPYSIPTQSDAELAWNELISSPQWRGLNWKNSGPANNAEKIKFLHNQVQRISP